VSRERAWLRAEMGCRRRFMSVPRVTRRGEVPSTSLSAFRGPDYSDERRFFGTQVPPCHPRRPGMETNVSRLALRTIAPLLIVTASLVAMGSPAHAGRRSDCPSGQFCVGQKLATTEVGVSTTMSMTTT
jgi:hypothetical protein